MDRRVTPPLRVTLHTWGLPPQCKQALILSLCSHRTYIEIWSTRKFQRALEENRKLDDRRLKIRTNLNGRFPREFLTLRVAHFVLKNSTSDHFERTPRYPASFLGGCFHKLPRWALFQCQNVSWFFRVSTYLPVAIFTRAVVIPRPT